MIKQTIKQGAVTVCAITGSLEVGKQSKLKEDLQKQAGPDPARVVLEMSGVDFIDSACLGAIVALSRKIREGGGDLRLAQLTDEVRSIFQITRLDKVLKIFDSLQEATASFAS